MDDLMNFKLQSLKNGPLNQYGLFPSNLEVRQRHKEKQKEKLTQFAPNHRTCDIKKSCKDLAERGNRPGHLPQIGQLIDAVEDLTIECLSSEAFLEMLKRWHEKRSEKKEVSSAL